MAEPVTIDGEVPTKGNLVLVPDDPDALTVEGGDPAAALHVTVKYIGDLDRWDDDARAMAQEALTAWAARLGPVKATVAKVGPLGDEGAMVLFLDAPELSAARPDLSEAIDSIAELFGADTTDKYPSYKPHLTVGYNVAAPEGWEGREVLFNAARAQWATEHFDAPLGGAWAAAVDGDGDGFVHDGTPQMRPVVPGLDLDAEGVVIPKRPKGGRPQQVADTVKVRRNRVGNVDTQRLKRRRRRLIDEIDDSSVFYPSGRHGFAMRAAELTVIESELERRGELSRKDRYTTTILPDPAAARRSRSSGKVATRNPFAEQLDAPGDSGSATPGWDGRVHRLPDDVEVDLYGDDLDRWSREVPILPDRLIEWAARGANLGGLRRRDDNRLRNLRQLANDILSARRSGVDDDEIGDAHEKLWIWLTRRQDSRQALSRALHDGPSPEERELYGIVHQHFLDYSARRWPEWGDVAPAQRVSTEDGPFDPNHGWKKQAERPKDRGTGFTSWDSVAFDEPYGHEVRPRRDRRGNTTWVGDVPKSQILGRFGDTDNELIVARDPEALQRFLGAPANPFAERLDGGEAGEAAGPVEMDDTLRSILSQRGSRVDPEAVQEAWAEAVRDPGDLAAIRAAIPPKQLRSWQQTYGADAVQAMRMGKGGVPPLEEVLAHNARRLTEAVPLTRDNLGVNGFPTAAQIGEHDPELLEWLRRRPASSQADLRVPITRRQLADLLKDPDPPAEGVRYLKMLRRAAARDVGRRGGSVELLRTNTQGTESPFITKGGSGLTSWTTDYATAAKYSTGGVQVSRAVVPADRILAFDTYGLHSSIGFMDFSGVDSYPLPGREVLVTTPEVIERLDADQFPLLPEGADPAAPVALAAAVDGDGDGFVHDGTPRMRPVGPQDVAAERGGRKRRKAPEPPDDAEDAAEALEQGRGDCFPVAVHTAEALEREGKANVRVVHGRPIYQGEGPGEADDGRFWHAWTEYDETFPGSDATLRMVVDRSNDNDVTLPAALYYGVGGLNDGSQWSDWPDQPPVKRYERSEAVREALAAQHWGPWGDDDPTSRNPFTERLDGGDPDVVLGSGRGSPGPYPGMRPVTPDERKALRVEGRPIPPAWTDVYVAEDPDADMLARGLDRKGRHVYIYSAAHERRQAAAKYERSKAVASRVHLLDEALERDAMDDPTAAATMLIRHFGLRPGSTADTKARKKAYGATTLQARHVKQYPETGRTTLSFMGKSGQKITVSTRDPRIYNLMERWTAGKEGTTPLFDTSDGLVLLYVKQHLGEEFLTKDLRTLLANAMALDMVSSMRRPTTQAKFRAARNKVADAVAKALGNTRQVTLSNYIDPTVFAPWEGALPA